ncbi:hypothetical protein L838_4824 [Mycobacterium avium MAV_120709_2344]|nr:hypothetical protein L838_4824 [Mycobacterium avium MAV_120709_2344]ETZ42202.1 hypothetical protein L839_3980 [Mycobacterium avium MAV_120809_2495]ETZ52176.1 hypothetical protein L840_5271 [Mycobacterium sp. MAC_011194_8550]ETZ68874.1 hypothetical protein L841_1440 [Mycobacterium sp. MAC_080597_8934]
MAHEFGCQPTTPVIGGMCAVGWFAPRPPSCRTGVRRG